MALTQAASAPPPPATEPPTALPEADAALPIDAEPLNPIDAAPPAPPTAPLPETAPPPETADAGAAGVLIPAAPGQNEPGPIGATPQRHTASHVGGCSTQASAPGAPWSLAAACALWAARRRRQRATRRPRGASRVGGAL